mgnify:CR=1 FL=1
MAETKQISLSKISEILSEEHPNFVIEGFYSCLITLKDKGYEIAFAEPKD